jgi:hypothetical protein
MTKDEALDKMADNARELGLDYEPVDGTQVSKVWWDGEKLMAKPIPLEDICQPVQEPWSPNDTAHRPGGLPQDFIKHEVELFDDWSEWVNPKAEQYFMKCCDCGLVHEMQFKVAKYSEGDECEFAEDADLQAVFRARRTTPPAQPAPVQEPIGYAVPTFDFDNSVIKKVHYAGTVPVYATPPEAQPVPVQEPSISVQWLAEMIISDCGCSTNNERLLERITARIEQHICANTPPAARPAVPDALTSADIQEHIEYVAGWNDCRQAMMEMMK